MDAEYYRHASTGRIAYDPGVGTRHFDPWYALLECDEGIVDYFVWLLCRRGVAMDRGSRWGAHVTFVRGEPASESAWGLAAGEEVPFRYAHVARWDNGRHVWLDVWCPRLSEVRVGLGLPAKERFHLTLGRLR